jgi:hypothetical protein
MKWLLMRLSRKAGMSCAQVMDLVQSYLDGELPDGPERDRLIAHLEMCRPCGLEAETYERIKASLAGSVPAAAVARLEQFASTVPELAARAPDDPDDADP